MSDEFGAVLEGSAGLRNAGLGAQASFGMDMAVGHSKDYGNDLLVGLQGYVDGGLEIRDKGPGEFAELGVKFPTITLLRTVRVSGLFGYRASAFYDTAKVFGWEVAWFPYNEQSCGNLCDSSNPLMVRMAITGNPERAAETALLSLSVGMYFSSINK